MGKRQLNTISAATTRSEPHDSWTRDLQLQTVAVDTTRWQSAQHPTLWRSFTHRSRARKFH
jgi:hypothetical protein